ncbi:protein phosphatase inhibitor 2 [Elgaria multicarinata webbii]|uniref:protein phosphatase inhibitor 2 n=1 Tax=Elgaria multicarinata webbii TaxID=159646 RepID=UPI002FCCBBA6
MEAKSSSSSSSGRPVKSILKNRSGSGGRSGGPGLVASGALTQPQQQQPPPPPPPPPQLQAASLAQPGSEGPMDERKKSQKWDEMNILATYHPVGKDYGLMKIDEPSTPYHVMVGEDEDAGSDTEANEAPSADVLAKKLEAAADGKGPKILSHQEESSDEEDEEEAELSAEDLEKKKQFEMKRKMHYNEAQNIKLARQLIAKELRGDVEEEEEDDDDDEEMRDTTDSRRMKPPPVPAPSDPLENISHSLEEVCSGL